MIAYGITYRVRGTERDITANVEAKDMKSAKRKLGKKHGYKDGRMIQIKRSSVLGYF